MLGVLFKGTESTTFDCDDFSGAADLPVGVVGTRDYLALQSLIIIHNTSVARVTTKPSPLLSESFILSYRLLQVLALALYSYNVWYAVKQLRAFGVLSQEWRRELFLSKEERDPAAKDKGPAVAVISLNLVRPTPLSRLSTPLPATQPTPPPRLPASSPPLPAPCTRPIPSRTWCSSSMSGRHTSGQSSRCSPSSSLASQHVQSVLTCSGLPSRPGRRARASRRGCGGALHHPSCRCHRHA